MNARCLVLLVTFGAFLLATGCSTSVELPDEKSATTAPSPRAKREGEAKTWPELLVGTWKQVEPAITDGTITEFTADGQFISRMIDRERGLRIATIRYRLDRAILTFDPSNATETPLPDWDETWERTYVIESLTEEQLVITLIIKKQYKLNSARKIARSSGKPVEQIMKEVHEERHSSKYLRVKE